MKKVAIRILVLALIALALSPICQKAFAQLSVNVSYTIRDENGDSFDDVVFQAFDSENIPTSGIEVTALMDGASVFSKKTDSFGRAIFYDPPIASYTWQSSSGQSGSFEIGEHTYNVDDIEELLLWLIAINFMNSENRGRSLYENIAGILGYDLLEHPMPLVDGTNSEDNTLIAAEWIQWSNGLVEHIDNLRLTQTLAERLSRSFLDIVMATRAGTAAAHRFQAHGALVIKNVEIPGGLELRLTDHLQFRGGLTYRQVGGGLSLALIVLASLDLMSLSSDPATFETINVLGTTIDTRTIQVGRDFLFILSGISGYIFYIVKAGRSALSNAAMTIFGTGAAALSAVLTIAQLWEALEERGLESLKDPTFWIELLSLVSSLALTLVGIIAMLGMAGITSLGSVSLATVGATLVGIASIIGIIVVVASLIVFVWKYFEALDEVREQMSPLLTKLWQIRSELKKTDTSKLEEDSDHSWELALAADQLVTQIDKKGNLNEPSRNLRNQLRSARYYWARLSSLEGVLADDIAAALTQIEEFIASALYKEIYLGPIHSGTWKAHLTGILSLEADCKISSPFSANSSYYKPWPNDATKGDYERVDVYSSDGTSLQISDSSAEYPFLSRQETDWLGQSFTTGWAWDIPTEKDSQEKQLAISYRPQEQFHPGHFLCDPDGTATQYDEYYKYTVARTDKAGNLRPYYQMKFYIDDSKPYWLQVWSDYLFGENGKLKAVQESLRDASDSLEGFEEASVFKPYRLEIITPKKENPIVVGDPTDPATIYVAVNNLPPWITSFLPPNFEVKIGQTEASFEFADTFQQQFGIFTLKVYPPIQPSEGKYDLEIKATSFFGGIVDSETESEAVVYTSAPSQEPIEKGLAYLRTSQYADGSWRSSVGVTALCALAFLNAGYDETDTDVNQAIQYILSKAQADGSIYVASGSKEYETSLSILALVATHNSLHKSKIDNARNWLVNSQWDESCLWGSVSKSNWFYGGFGYGYNVRPDLSNTQFALLALDAAGLPNDDPAWRKAQVFLHRCQKVNFPVTLDIEGTPYTVQPWNYAGTTGGYDGGFLYDPGSNPYVGGAPSMGSMTGAGIWGLLLSGVPKSDQRVTEAINWVANHYTWDNNPNCAGYRRYYYYLSMAKALTMYGEKTIGGHDWYQELHNKITSPAEMISVGTDKAKWVPVGTYEDYVPDLSTAYAILSLQTRAAAPPVQRLSYLTFILRSNCLIRVLDPEGNLVGYNYMTGLGENQVPRAIYSGQSSEPQYVVIVNPVAGTYKLELVGIEEGPYTIEIQGNYGEDITDTFQFTGEIAPSELQGSQVTITAIAGPVDIYLDHPPEFEKIIDITPPTTTLEIGEPKYVDPTDSIYVSSATPFTLTAEDNLGGTGVASTFCRVYNSSYDTSWLEYSAPFYLTGLSDGGYSIDYYSTDNIGSTEPTNTTTVILDNTAPQTIVSSPPAGWALQDGVTFIALSTDLSGTYSLNFSIREANGDQGTTVGFEDIPATHNAITGKWELFFNTLQLPDGFYTVLANAEDNLGHTASIAVPYSIRNWAVLELLPATPNNKAGRTMPVKFALRVAASVDPNQPFVYNEELTIRICATDNPNNVLQISTFGDTARDYRINTLSEQYITNFQTLKTPKTYMVGVWRKDMLIGTFGFKTVK